MKEILDILDKQENDGLSERISKEPISKKYWLAFGGSIALLFLTIIVNGVSMLKKKEYIPSPLYSIVVKNQQVDMQKITELPVTFPFAHQSFKNVTSWILDAVGETYSFNFSNFYQKVQKAEQYFTPEGYKTYVQALQTSGIEKTLIEKKIDISIVPLQDPILINGGMSGETEFWRFRFPVLVSYSSGKDPVLQKYMMELLVLRIPAYQNYRGLAIAEYNMAPI